MSRIPRISGALVLSATLLGAAVPASQARTLAKPQAPSVSGSWLDAALALLGDFAVPHAARTHQTPGVKSATILDPPPPGTAHPMGCSTIDPNGNTICHGGF